MATAETPSNLPLEVKYEAEMVDYASLLSSFDSFGLGDSGSDLASLGYYKAPALAKALAWPEAILLNSALTGNGPLTGLPRLPLRSSSPSYSFPPFPTTLYPWSNPAFDR